MDYVYTGCNIIFEYTILYVAPLAPSTKLRMPMAEPHCDSDAQQDSARPPAVRPPRRSAHAREHEELWQLDPLNRGIPHHIHRVDRAKVLVPRALASRHHTLTTHQRVAQNYVSRLSSKRYV